MKLQQSSAFWTSCAYDCNDISVVLKSLPCLAVVEIDAAQLDTACSMCAHFAGTMEISDAQYASK